MRFLSVAILCAVAANLLAQEKPGEGQPVKKAQVPAEATRVDHGPEKPAEGTRVDRPFPARHGHYTIHVTWTIEGDLPPTLPHVSSPDERLPQTVSEATRVSAPFKAEKNEDEYEQLMTLLRTLKAKGAKMEGLISFPKVKDRVRVIDLKADVKIEVPKEGEKVSK